MSGIFGSVTIKGNRITDAVQQTATVGIPIPFGYGKFPVSGNVVGVSELRERVIRRRQGKGGVKTEDYVYNLDYAIGFCEGPIRGYWTIKRNGKVVYSTDPATPIEDQAYATKWLQKATLYLGTEDQAPDSTLETIYGVGQVSAMKGLAYIVVEDDDVTADAGAVPNYEAVVTATLPEFYVTSKPYPFETGDELAVSASLYDGELRTLLREYETQPDEVNVVANLTSASLGVLLRSYEGAFEEVNVNATLQDGELRVLLKVYDTALPESLDVNATLQSGELKVILITYNDWPTENLDVSATLQAGYLGP